MEAKQKKQATPKPMRWPDADWDFLALVAKSLGVSRSAFVRNAALTAAKATAAELPPYSVAVAKSTPQNTRTNQISRPIAKQRGSEVGGGGSRSRSKPEAFSGPITEELERKGGGFSPNEEKPKANKAKALRS